MKHNTLHNQTGFAHMALIVILVVAAGIGSIAYVVYTHQQGTGQSADDTKVVSQSTAKTAAVPAAPEINQQSDLDKALATLNQVDPSSDSQSDLNAMDSQLSGL